MKLVVLVLCSYEICHRSVSTSKESLKQKKPLVPSYSEASTQERSRSLAHGLFHKASIGCGCVSKFQLKRMTTVFGAQHHRRLNVTRCLIRRRWRMSVYIEAKTGIFKYFVIVFISRAVVEKCRKTASPKQSFTKRRKGRGERVRRS